MNYWQPRFPIADIDERYVRDAERLREALLPGLNLPSGTSITQRASVCAQGFAMYEGGDALQCGLRHLLSRTIARAGNEQDWNRVELFLDDDYVRRAQPEALEFPEIAVAVARIGKPEALAAEEREQLWAVIIDCFAERLESGIAERQLKGELRAFVLRTVPFLAVSSKALARSFNAKVKAWQESGIQALLLFTAPRLTPADIEALRILADRHGNNLGKAWREALATDCLSAPVLAYVRRSCSTMHVPEWVRKAVRRKASTTLSCSSLQQVADS